MTRAFVATLILLILACAWIAYRETTLRQTASEPAHKARIAQIEAEAQAERDALAAQQAAELAETEARLTEAVRAAQDDRAALEARLADARRTAVAHARSGPAELRAARGRTSSGLGCPAARRS